MGDPCAAVRSVTPTDGTFRKIWNWIQARAGGFLGWNRKAWNAQDRTVEIRLLAFGLFVFVGLTLIWVEFWDTNPHHINNAALATLAGTCGLGALSMRGEP